MNQRIFLGGSARVLFALIFLVASFLAWSQKDEKFQWSAEDVVESYQHIIDDEQELLDSLLEADNNLEDPRKKVMNLFRILEICPLEDNLLYISKIESIVNQGIKEDSNALNEEENLRLKAKLSAFKLPYYNHSGNDSLYSLAAEDHLSSLEQLKDSVSLHGRYAGIAAAFKSRGEYSKALKTLERGFDFYSKINSKTGEGKYLLQLAYFYADLGDLEQADYFIKEAISVENIIHDSTRTTRGKYLLGLYYLKYNLLDSAEKCFNASLDRSIRLSELRETLQSYQGLAQVYKKQGQIEKAIKFQNSAFELAQETKNYEFTYKTSVNIARLYIENQDFNRAIEILGIIYEIFNQLKIEEPLAITRVLLAQAHYLKGNIEKAHKHMSTAIPILEQANNRDDIVEAYYYAYKIDSAANNFKSAYLHYQKYNRLINELNSNDFKAEESKKKYLHKLAIAEEQKEAEAALRKSEVAKKNAELQSERLTRYLLYGGLSLALLFGGFIFNRFKVTHKQKGIIESQKKQVDEAYGKLEEKNQEILDSINYAYRIQTAILPPTKLIKQHLDEFFILYKPKDIVAGDFYWFEKDENRIHIAACDCTGHGVPGALVSVVCNHGLNRSVREFKLKDPASILDKTRELVIAEFEKSEEEVKDGMDAALVSLTFDKDGGRGTEDANNCAKLEYAGAHNPLWVIKNGNEEIIEIKADKQPIGKFDHASHFTLHQMQLDKGDSLYIFSDGYADQFGGESGKKFKIGNLKKLILSIHQKSMDEQKSLLDQAFVEWKRKEEQLDDVCVIGVRV